jgi:HrpA-like RNA helicase
MASFPLEPNYARAVLASKEYGCTLEVLEIISVLSSSSKLFLDITEHRDAATEARRKFRHASGDHLTILNAVRSYQEISASDSKWGRKDWCRKHFLNERTLIEAKEIKDQLSQTCARVGIDWRVSCGESEENVLMSLGHGLIQNSAFMQPDGSYKQTIGQSVRKLGY